jgi:hypothetical protein
MLVWKLWVIYLAFCKFEQFIINFLTIQANLGLLFDTELFMIRAFPVSNLILDFAILNHHYLGFYFNHNDVII